MHLSIKFEPWWTLRHRVLQTGEKKKKKKNSYVKFFETYENQRTYFRRTTMQICYMKNSGDTTLVYNFVHNSSTWRVVIGGGVTHRHPSINHNSLCGRVMHIVVAPESLMLYTNSIIYMPLFVFFLSKFYSFSIYNGFWVHHIYIYINFSSVQKVNRIFIIKLLMQLAF